MDRKARIREYKETPRPMGVYRVRNITDDKSLVGVSLDVPAMLNRHQAQLKMGVHANRKLQDDWNRLGAQSFAFETLDLLKPAEEPGYDPRGDLEILGQMWLDKLSPFDQRGYNSKPKPRD